MTSSISTNNSSQNGNLLPSAVKHFRKAFSRQYEYFINGQVPAIPSPRSNPGSGTQSQGALSAKDLTENGVARVTTSQVEVNSGAPRNDFPAEVRADEPSIVENVSTTIVLSQVAKVAKANPWKILAIIVGIIALVALVALATLFIPPVGAMVGKGLLLAKIGLGGASLLLGTLSCILGVKAMKIAREEG